MIKNEKVKFISSFMKWKNEPGNKCGDPNSFRKKIKYSCMSFWQKDLIDAYINGVLDVRIGRLPKESCYSMPSWAENED